MPMWNGSKYTIDIVIVKKNAIIATSRCLD